MKKYIIIGLLILVGLSLVLIPILKKEDIDTNTDVLPAEFLMNENLAIEGNAPVELKIRVNNDETEKLELFLNDSLIKFWNKPTGNINLNINPGKSGVGAKRLDLISTLKNGQVKEDNRVIRVLSDVVPELLTVRIINSYPHNTSSFTQGLEFYEGNLFESTGDPGHKGQSLIAQVDMKSGVHHSTRKIGLDATYFGEGITILNNTIYQLTWRGQKCFKYSLGEEIKLTGDYDYPGEGWGLCNDGKNLIMSNGSERIVFRDPNTFSIVRTIEVYNQNGPIINLNELEYIDGKIYANVWMTNFVVVIDPQSGKVLQQIDATELAEKGKGAGEVLNGIAYNPVIRKIYMTGKYWEKLFEVEFFVPGT